MPACYHIASVLRLLAVGSSSEVLSRLDHSQNQVDSSRTHIASHGVAVVVAIVVVVVVVVVIVTVSSSSSSTSSSAPQLSRLKFL